MGEIKRRIQTKITSANSHFVIAGVSSLNDNVVLNLSFVLLMNFSAENPLLRKTAKRYKQAKREHSIKNNITNNSRLTKLTHN
jgi:hypothetical protein